MKEFIVYIVLNVSMFMKGGSNNLCPLLDIGESHGVN